MVPSYTATVVPFCSAIDTLARFEETIEVSAVFGGFADDALAGVASPRGHAAPKFAHKGYFWGM